MYCVKLFLNYLFFNPPLHGWDIADTAKKERKKLKKTKQ